jgi:hypothetical protein
MKRIVANASSSFTISASAAVLHLHATALNRRMMHAADYAIPCRLPNAAGVSTTGDLIIRHIP